MSSVQPKAPAIPPVAPSERRPFWSVMMPVYNRTTYLERALRGVLDQDPGPDQMQIEILDNCSDQVDMRQFVHRIAGDRVSFHQHPRNLGIFGNLNACIARANGEWVHVLHDDDMVRPGFYRELKKGIEHRSDVGAAFCRNAVIDPQDRQIGISEIERETPGIIDRWMERISLTARCQFCATVVRRSVYEALGGFSPELGGSACDWEMWVRIASRYPFWFEPQVLASFRHHPGSASAANIRNGEIIADRRLAIEAIKNYLPPEAALLMVSRIHDFTANMAIRFAVNQLQAGHFARATTYLRDALLTSQSPAVVRAIEGGIFRHFQPFAQDALKHIAGFRQYPQDPVRLKSIRAIRQYVASQWLDLPPEYVEQALAHELGGLHRAVLESGILLQPLTQDESLFLARVVSLERPLDRPEDVGRRLARDLYKQSTP
jgi:glycosyltransferase involved in cell wall biosynthesis